MCHKGGYIARSSKAHRNVSARITRDSAASPEEPTELERGSIPEEEANTEGEANPEGEAKGTASSSSEAVLTERGEDNVPHVEVAVGGHKSDVESDDEDYFSGSNLSYEMSQDQLYLVEEAT